MARLCGSCNKFASIDESADVDIENEEVDESTLRVEVRVPLLSACCGEEMAESTLEWEADLDSEHPCNAEPDTCQECGGSGEVGVKCENCGGAGTLPDYGEIKGGKCPNCEGTGKDAEGCDHCDGTGREPWEDEEGGERYEVVGSVDADFTSDTDKPKLTTVTRGPNKGKTRMTPSRYLRTYYGAHLRATVRCNRCEEEFEVEGDALESASSFEGY